MFALYMFNRCRGDSRISRQCSHNIICEEIFAVCRKPPHPTMCTNSNRGNRRERRLSTFRYIRTTYVRSQRSVSAPTRYIRTAHPIALRGFPPGLVRTANPAPTIRSVLDLRLITTKRTDFSPKIFLTFCTMLL